MTQDHYTFPPDRGCCIPHDNHPRNQLLAAVCPSPDSGVSYLAITQHHGKKNRQTRCIYGPVRVATSKAWQKLMHVSDSLGIHAGWSPENVSVFHPLDSWSKPAPSLDHFADVVSTGGLEE